MNPNTPVGCPQCGGRWTSGQAGRRLALTGLFASVTDWIEVDIYSCPACGRLAFFRTNFLPQPKKHVPVEPEPTDVDTTAFYVPGTGELVKCPVCGKEHPRDDAFCPLCGTRRDQPCPWCGKWFPAAQPSVPGAATAEMRNKRNQASGGPWKPMAAAVFLLKKSTPPHTGGYLRCLPAGTAGCVHPLGAPP